MRVHTCDGKLISTDKNNLESSNLTVVSRNCAFGGIFVDEMFGRRVTKKKNRM